ncbi:bola protein [Kalaharituber pfeilii]|nr:bola protein [Kalaharituber pfeilii]
MEINVSYLEEIITKRLNASHVEVQDLSGGCGQIFEAVIVSPEFRGKTTLARHRLVNNTLKEEIAKVHAWSQKCYTEEEWEKKKAQDATTAA